MTRLRVPGIIYVHFIGIMLIILSFLAVKDVHFSDLSTPPTISNTQGWIMIACFAFACLLIIVMFINGLLIKNQKLGGLGTLALFILYTSLAALIFIGIYPKLFDQTDTQYSYRMIAIPIACIFIFLGTLIFSGVKFADDREKRWFILAVRQELKNPSKIACPECAKVQGSDNKTCINCDAKLK